MSILYTGTHFASFRSGEPATIIGVEWVKPGGHGGRACFRIRFEDGVEDVTPICDVENYTLTEGPG
jgi:hypothetical protein